MFYKCLYILGFFAILCAPIMGQTKPSVRQELVTSVPKWQDFIERQNQSLSALQACEENQSLCESDGIQKWHDLVKGLKSENKLRQLITVNRWFNRIPYKHDEYAYDAIDYWADTKQLIEQKGDCEDYALAKYFTLRLLGFSSEDMKINIVYDQDNYLNHAVLVVRVNDARYLLDINSDSMDPSPMNQRYKKLYSFNEQFAWWY